MIGSFTLVLAFVKINGQAFHYVILNIVQTVRRPSRRVWSKFYTKAELNELRREAPEEVAEKIKAIPKVSYSRLRDLSLMVNTGDIINLNNNYEE